MNKPEDVTGAKLRELRESKGMTIREFWSPLFVMKSTAAYYETGVHPIPNLVRLACYLHFFCGINLHMKAPKKAARLLKQNGLND